MDVMGYHGIHQQKAYLLVVETGKIQQKLSILGSQQRLLQANRDKRDLVNVAETKNPSPG